MKGIATDTYTFEDLISRGAIYVDKTDYVYNLVSGEKKFYFLSRPRRFGKSLLLSTLESYFEGRKDLFKGLKIYDLEQKWEKFPVIHLDMAAASSSENKETLEEGMCNQVKYAAKALEVEIEKAKPASMFGDLIQAAKEKFGKNVVILIDEYDKPILDSMNKDWGADIPAYLGDFYQQIKSANKDLRFAFVTGVSKFAHTSLFSGMNNPTDISRDKKYANMLGYTQEELETNFGEYINCLCEELNQGKEKIMNDIKRWYNGNRFTVCNNTLYNPVSIGKLLSNLRFENYWANTGTPRFLVDQFKKNPFELDENVKKWYPLAGSSKFDLNNLDGVDLAVQSGYLVISNYELDEDTNEYFVQYDFPNKEIRDSWNVNILSLVSGITDNHLMSLAITLSKSLKSADIDTFMQNIEWFFSGIPYENAGEITEGYFRNQLRTLFVLFGIPNQCEVQQSRQRTDIAAQTRKMALVFELKMMKESVSDKENECARLLKEAIEQGRNKHYIDKYKAESEIVKGMAMVFDEQTRRVKAWEVWE